MRGGQPQADATLRAVFERFDANRSGRLDYSELRNCLHALGIDVTPPEAAQVLARYDADHSGLMELDEFARLARGLGYQPASYQPASHPPPPSYPPPPAFPPPAAPAYQPAAYPPTAYPPPSHPRTVPYPTTSPQSYPSVLATTAPASRIELVRARVS